MSWLRRLGTLTPRRWRAIDDHWPVIDATADGTIAHVNGKAAALLGVREDTLLGRGLFSVARPTDGDHTAAWRALGSGDHCLSVELVVGETSGPAMLLAAPDGRRGGLSIMLLSDPDRATLHEQAEKLRAIDRVQAVIEFLPSGEILRANEIFLQALGYELSEIVGRHLSLFVDEEQARSQAFADFWARLRAGEVVTGDVRRVSKSGASVWLQASFNPIFDSRGQVVRIVNFATVITGRVEAIETIAAGLERLAANDLRHRLPSPLDGRYDKIRTDLNRTSQALDDALQDVAGATAGVLETARDIAAASDDLARRSEQQAASLEQAAASVDELTSSAAQSAERARSAALQTSEARSLAEQADQVVQRAMIAMTAVSQRSVEMTGIIALIDGIAVQTNLLALNAGVEAARAGDAGRGFAVVAQEVRALAQRSAQAARDVRGLIAASQAEVDEGASLVTEGHEALGAISARIEGIDHLLADIAGGAAEQSIGLREASTAVHQIDRLTQQNAVTATHVSTAAAVLRTGAEGLSALVKRFSVSSAGSGVRSGPGGTRPRPTLVSMRSNVNSAALRAAPLEDDEA